MPATLPLKIDFGGSSPVQTGYTKFGTGSYLASRGYGWNAPTGLAVVDTQFSDPLLRDCIRGISGIFWIDVPDGTYRVSVNLVDPRQRTDKVEVTIGGVVSRYEQTQQAYFIQQDVPVTGGLLVIQFQATGLTTPYFGVASIVVESLNQPPPPLVVNAGPDIVSAAHDVTFTPTISGGVQPYVENWDYGDGQQGASRTHTYTNGNYVATLTVTDAAGQVGSDTITVQVNHIHPPPPPPGGTVETRHESIPDFAFGSPFESIKNGSWHDPSTWSTGTVPAGNDLVNVRHTVTVDQEAVCNSVTVHGGARLDQRGSKISFVNFLVRPEGVHVADGGFRLMIRDVPVTDTGRFGTGYISLGTTNWNGSRFFFYTWSRLSHELIPGMTVLHLLDPCVDWRVGDELVIPDTRQVSISGPWGIDTELHNEYATIAGISADGKTVTLLDPIVYDHPGAWGYDTKALQWAVINGHVEVNGWDGTTLRPGRQLHFTPAVGNLTRGAKVYSENPNGTRGHVMFIGHGVQVDIRGVCFDGLGRFLEDASNPDHKGRYGLHCHHAYSDHIVIEGCSIIGGRTRHIEQRYGITLHGVSDAIVQNNVVWNWRGSGIWTEVSTHHADMLPEAPVRNKIIANFVANVWGPLPGPESISQRGENGDGFEGAGIWLSTVEDEVKYNWIACCTVAIGEFVGWQGGFGELPIAVNPGDDPYTTGVAYNTIAHPQNGLGYNEMVACTSGWIPWNIGAYGSGGPPYWQNPGESVVKGQVGWHLNREHTFYYVCQNITQIAAIFRGGDQRSQGALIEGDYRQKDLKLDHCDIQGATVGYDSFPGCASTILNDCEFHNCTYGMVWTCRNAHGVPTEDSGRINVLSNCIFHNNDQDINVEWSDFPALFASDKLLLYNYQGIVGQNYKVFRNNQRGDFVPPPAHTDFGTHFMGSPENGLNNLQLSTKWEWKWDYGEAIPTYRTPQQGGSGWLPACVGAEVMPDGSVDVPGIVGGKVQDI